MRCKVTFKEVTTKTIEIEGTNIFEIMGLAEEYTQDPAEKIGFEKEPDLIEVVVTKIKEVCE